MLDFLSAFVSESVWICAEFQTCGLFEFFVLWQGLAMKPRWAWNSWFSYLPTSRVRESQSWNQHVHFQVFCLFHLLSTSGSLFPWMTMFLGWTDVIVICLVFYKTTWEHIVDIKTVHPSSLEIFKIEGLFLFNPNIKLILSNLTLKH